MILRALIIVAIAAGTAHAYPQYQLSRDVTCTGCHLSPAGGGLLSENGLVVAETQSQWGTAPEFLNGVVTPPTWLALGGDLRGAAGWDHSQPTTHGLVGFPMQADVYADAVFGDFSLRVNAGARDPEYRNQARTFVGSREHWLQYAHHGFYARLGRFMPVYGLRFVEHPAYDRQYGGTPLYGEAYAVATEYVSDRFEAHATGFVHDPLQASTEIGNGATLYTEARIASSTAVGLEGKYDKTRDDRKIYGGVTAKHYFATPDILVQGEVELVSQHVDAGGHNKQLVAYALGSWFVGALMVDLGVGVYDRDLHLRYLDREAADLNVHWFATSHVELVWINRLQMLELGAGGPSSGYSLLQLHYRL